jgi:hypothetical protein
LRLRAACDSGRGAAAVTGIERPKQCSPQAVSRFTPSSRQAYTALRSAAIAS